jgi:hypothetical protein
MSVSTCPHCGHERAANTLICPNCGQLGLPANQLNLVISLSVVSVAILATLLYWVISELIWLPAAQTGLGFVIDNFGLQNYVPYWTGLIERRGFFNANWLLLGAFLYIPIITIVTMRLGLRRAVVAALASPAPFAIMDTWSWWVRAVAIPSDVDRAGALLPLPGLLQFLAVFAISAVVVTPFYFLFNNIGRFLPKRMASGFLVQPVSGAAAIALPQATPPALPPKPLELPSFTPSPEITPAPKPQAVVVEESPMVPVQPSPTPEPLVPSVELPVEPSVIVPEPVALPFSPTSAPIPDEAEVEAAPPTEAAPRSGFPIWIAVAGLVGIAILGTLLIIFALRA